MPRPTSRRQDRHRTRTRDAHGYDAARLAHALDGDPAAAGTASAGGWLSWWGSRTGRVLRAARPLQTRVLGEDGGTTNAKEESMSLEDLRRWSQEHTLERFERTLSPRAREFLS